MVCLELAQVTGRFPAIVIATELIHCHLFGYAALGLNGKAQKSKRSRPFWPGRQWGAIVAGLHGGRVAPGEK
jgi:hypothetical protein